MPNLGTGTIKHELDDGTVVTMSVTIKTADGIPPTAPKIALELLLDKAIQILGSAATDEAISRQQKLFDNEGER